jgi:hypothetical protein
MSPIQSLEKGRAINIIIPLKTQTRRERVVMRACQGDHQACLLA